MLRMILSVTGVGLIVLGVFGGRPLDDLYKNITRSTPTLVQSEVATSDSNLVGTAVGSSDEGMLDLPADNNDDGLSDTLQPKVIVAAAENREATENKLVHVDLPDDSAVTGEDDTVVKLVTDPAALESIPAEEIKVALNTSEQQKSDARNAQVAMAATILAASGQAARKKVVAVAEPEGKQAELEEALSNTTGQLKNEMLVVIRDKVNMRDGPSIDHSVVLQLAQGQELMEFKREGRWVHVGAYGTSGKIGWVHQRLVGSGNMAAN